MHLNIFVAQCPTIYIYNYIYIYIDLCPQQLAVCTSAVESQGKLENNYLIIDRVELYCSTVLYYAILYCTVQIIK